MKRPVEIAIEFAIGLVIVASIVLYAEYFPNKDFPAKWLGLAASTAVLFGYPLYWTRFIAKSSRFWSYWSGFLLLHLIVLVMLLNLIERWPLVWFVFTTIAEFWLIYPILTKTLIHVRDRAHINPRTP
jgi:hypothetical protein